MYKFVLRYSLFIIILLFTSNVNAKTWQLTLEDYFDHVETFEDLNDWTPSVYGREFYEPEYAPQKSGGGLGIIKGFSNEVAAVTPYIRDFGSKYNWSGSKSVRMQTGANDVLPPYLTGIGANKLTLYFGDGDPTHGYSELYFFMMMRFQDWTDYDINTGYQWDVYDGDTYVLKATGGGNPNAKIPSTILANGVQLNRIQNATYYENLDTAKDNLGNNEWVYCNTGSGYRSIYVKLSPAADPDTKTMLNRVGSFVLHTSTQPWQVGVFKFLFFKTGFNSIYDFGDVGYDDDVVNTEQNQNIYGANNSCFNIIHYGLNHIGFMQEVTPAQWNAGEGAWGYDQSAPYGFSDRNWADYNTDLATDVDFTTFVLTNDWFGIEVRVDLGTLDNQDGGNEIWIYNKTGTVVAHDYIEGDYMLRHFDHRLNKIGIGGNRLGGGYSYDTYDPQESIWYMDDIIISADRIGVDYFTLFNGYIPVNIPVIGIESKTGQSVARPTSTGFMK